MDVSVILCTYNNADRLRITLNAFCRLNRPEGVEWELVAVNNNSTDETEHVIHSFADRLPVAYVYEPKQGKSRALNTGLHAAGGDLIVFTDDDVKPSPGWLIAYWDAYRERPEGYYFGGPIESEFEDEPPDDDLLDVAMPSVAGLNYGPEPSEEDFFVGANWACPSKYLGKVDPFNERLGLRLKAGKEKPSVGEETEVMANLRKNDIKGWYIPEAKIIHYVPDKKCNIEHVVSRMVEQKVDIESKSKYPSKVFGVPVGMYKAAIEHLISWRFAKMVGNNWKSRYLGWRIWKNRIKKYHSR